MLFSRSYLPEKYSKELFSCNMLEGELVLFRVKPDYAPEDFESRFYGGEDAVGIWSQSENSGVARNSIPFEHRHHYSNENFSKVFDFSAELTPEQILGFCEAIKVHPAHLVPLNSREEFALPRSILEAIIIIAKSDPIKSKFCEKDITLAKIAIQFEQERIFKFSGLVKAGERLKVQGEFELYMIFRKSCSTLSGINKLNEYKKEYQSSILLPYQDPSSSFSVINCVQKASLFFLEKSRSNNQLNLERKRWLVEASYQRYASIYRYEIGACSEAEYLGDVKDLLHDKGILCRATTIADILVILYEIKSKKETSSKIVKEEEFMQHLENNYLQIVAGALANYFAAEEAYRKEKECYQEQLGKAEKDETKIKKIFSDAASLPDSLFRRIIENNVLISMAFPPTIKTLSSRSPKSLE